MQDTKQRQWDTCRITHTTVIKGGCWKTAAKDYLSYIIIKIFMYKYTKLIRYSKLRGTRIAELVQQLAVGWKVQRLNPSGDVVLLFYFKVLESLNFTTAIKCYFQNTVLNNLHIPHYLENMVPQKHCSMQVIVQAHVYLLTLSLPTTHINLEL